MGFVTDLPDLDGDGIPDAFQNRKPIAEILGFDIPAPVKAPEPGEAHEMAIAFETARAPRHNCDQAPAPAFIACVHVLEGAPTRRYLQPSYETGYVGIALCDLSEHRPALLVAICRDCAVENAFNKR